MATIGIISKMVLLNAPKGHQPHISGCGIRRDRRKDKKNLRREGKRLCQFD